MTTASKEARAEWNRRYYHESGGKERIAASRTRYRQRNRQFVNEKKSKPCADCGGSFPPYVMDFDHVTGNKEANVAQMVTYCASIEKLEAEIAKCELVCANCHRIRTYERNNAGVAQ